MIDPVTITQHDYPDAPRWSAIFPHNKRCKLQSGCTEPTKENKDFCTDHIEESPYVQDILSRLAQRDAEDQAIIQGQMTYQEILNTETCKEVELFVILNGGDLPDNDRGGIATGTIARECLEDDEISVLLADKCAEALWRAGRVKLTKAFRKRRAVVVGSDGHSAMGKGSFGYYVTAVIKEVG